MNRTLRVIGALVVGYVVTAMIVIVGVTGAAKLLVPVGEGPGTEYLVANIAISFLAALAGGFAARQVGRADRLEATLLLATLVLVLGLLMEGGSAQPRWYGLTIPLIGAVGVVLGGVGDLLLRRFRPT